MSHDTPWRILLLQGANMNYLGRREPERYGTTTAAEVDALMRTAAAERGVGLEIFYTNTEGIAIDRIYRANDEGMSGLIMNPAGFQYAGFALRDCLLAVRPTLPYVEIHLSKHSITGGLQTVTAAACKGFICGCGIDSYLLGLEAMIRILRRRASAPS